MNNKQIADIFSEVILKYMPGAIVKYEIELRRKHILSVKHRGTWYRYQIEESKLEYCDHIDYVDDTARFIAKQIEIIRRGTYE